MAATTETNFSTLILTSTYAQCCAKWQHSSMYCGTEAYLDLVLKQVSPSTKLESLRKGWSLNCFIPAANQFTNHSKSKQIFYQYPYACSPASSTFPTERNMLKITISGKLSRTQPHSVDWVTIVCNTKLTPDSSVKLCWHQKLKSESYFLLAVVYHALTEMKIKSKNI